MNLLDRLKLLVQSTVNDAVSNVVHDLVGEDQKRGSTRKDAPFGERGSGPISTAETEKLLRQADKRVEKLRDDLASTVAREKRAEQAWREAGVKAVDLNSEVDALLRNNQSDAARAKLQQAQRAAQQTADLDQELQRFAKMSVQLREEIATLEDQLGQIRQRIQRAGEREAHVDVAEQAQQARQAQRKDTTQVEQVVRAREEHIAQREDRSDAKEDVNTADKANTLDEPLDSSRMADILKKLQEQRNQQNAGNKD